MSAFAEIIFGTVCVHFFHRF